MGSLLCTRVCVYAGSKWVVCCVLVYACTPGVTQANPKPIKLLLRVFARSNERRRARGRASPACIDTLLAYLVGRAVQTRAWVLINCSFNRSTDLRRRRRLPAVTSSRRRRRRRPIRTPSTFVTAGPTASGTAGRPRTGTASRPHHFSPGGHTADRHPSPRCDSPRL